MQRRWTVTEEPTDLLVDSEDPSLGDIKHWATIKVWCRGSSLRGCPCVGRGHLITAPIRWCGLSPPVLTIHPTFVVLPSLFPEQLCFQATWTFIRSRIVLVLVIVGAVTGMVITTGVNPDRVCRTVVHDTAG